MYALIKKILFLLPAERAHYFVAFWANLTSKTPLLRSLVFSKQQNHKPIHLMGLKFPNKIGLAAGFDKNASMLNWLSKIGFGFIEVGTVTPKPQAGNPKPRLFRLPEDQALINRMGFNNDGVDAMVEQLKNRPKNIIVGGNIGKNKVTPNEHAADDYIYCFKKLINYVDYFVVNVSSPNTPGLRELQEKDALLKILSSLQDINIKHENPKPILLKIAPDLTDHQLKDIADIVKESKIQGIVATNTTIERNHLNASPQKVQKIGNGGLSGAPVKNRSTEVITKLRSFLGAELIIIGVGGIMSMEDAKEKLKAGANLVQVYTGFIYRGPKLIKKIAAAT